MAPSGLSKSQWAVPQKQARIAGKWDPEGLEAGTKAFKEMLAQPANKPQTKPATTKPQAVVGGIPPHVSREREDNASQAFTSAPANAIKPPDCEDNLRAQQTTTVQNCSASPHQPRALQSHPQPTLQSLPAPPEARPSPPHSRNAPSNVAPRHTYPPTPASHWPTKQVPLAQANSSMNPFVRKVVGNRFRLAVTQDSPPDSPLSPALNDDTRTRSQHRTPNTHGSPQTKKWRPKHSEDLESQSLPSTAASVIFSDDDDSHFPDHSQDGRTARSKDVRANIADELDIVPKDNSNGWVNKNAWKDYPSSPSSNQNADERSFGTFAKGWRYTYCEDWIASLPDSPPPVATIIQEQIDQNWRCDVDTKDGFLMSPVEYPSTEINRDDPSSDPEWERRFRGTASMRSIVDFLKMQKLALKHDEQEKEYNARNPPRYLMHQKQDPSPEPQSSPAPNSKPVTGPSEAVQQSGQNNVTSTQVPNAPVQQAVQGDIDGDYLKIPCHLRPVEPTDVPQILDIYNWEVMNGYQALDTEPLCLQDIQRLFKECQSAKTPFIVAVQGTSSESASRQETHAQSRGPYKQSRPTGPYQNAREAQPRSDKILGFGFISCPMPGLAGSVHSNVGRFIGRVHFYVEHASRRNGIGRALLHRLTRCCSKFCISVDWYQWYDPVGSAVFDEPDFNPRNYSRLYIETSSSGEKDPDNGWYEKFLDGMGYLFMSTLDKTRKVRYGPDGQWRDTIVWQHDCRDPKYIREFD
ncbi:hypothetical protein VMCG_06674 [Cytospora schulzeri]|uniref:N-acetyltransferase domain-containing protein n=1 Tax=Cytospora schulzeri TaxID=448051 RepID=A0A423W6V1_9PEZI|nr:hypothetical protein VMCG_06674 [Valsa malicola]